MLSDGPWSLVESFPRRQGPSVPSRLGSQPPRSQGPRETRSIGTNSPMSLDPSVPCPVATKEPMTTETMSPWGFHRLVTMVPVDLGTLSHRLAMSLATPVHRRMGRQVPWPIESPWYHGPSTTPGPMMPGDQGRSGHRRSSSSRNIETEVLPGPRSQACAGNKGSKPPAAHRRCWGRGLAGPSVPSLRGQHGSNAFLGTWVPSDCGKLGRRRPTTTLEPRCPGIQRSRYRQ